MVMIALSMACQLGAVLLLKQLALIHPVFSLADAALHPLFWTALSCLGMQAILWQGILAKHPLSYVYPLNSIIYPASLVAGWVFFAEAFTIPRLAGSAIILLGVSLMSRKCVS